jgi:hypothetical protein
VAPLKIWLFAPTGVHYVDIIRKATSECDDQTPNGILAANLSKIIELKGSVLLQRSGQAHDVPSAMPHTVLTIFPKKRSRSTRSFCVLHGTNLFSPNKHIKNAILWANRATCAAGIRRESALQEVAKVVGACLEKEEIPKSRTGIMNWFSNQYPHVIKVNRTRKKSIQGLRLTEFNKKNRKTEQKERKSQGDGKGPIL